MCADQCFGSGRVQGVKMRLNSIGSGLLEVCEKSECVADQCFGSGRLQGGKNEA